MAQIILGGEAVAAGVVTRHELGRWHEPVYRGVYAPKDADLSLRDRAIAAWLASKRRGVVAGVAASALHGAPWVDADVPIELVGVKIRPQDGLVPRTERIADDEITRLSGLPVTTRDLVFGDSLSSRHKSVLRTDLHPDQLDGHVGIDPRGTVER